MAVAPVAVSAAEKPKPNFIFVLADDMGYGDLNCYGGTEARTPHIDRLASEGIRFTQFYVNAPICSPSRTAFTTGQYPARWGITSFINNRGANARRGMAQWLDTSAPTLPRALTQAGYVTGHFGKWHMGGGRDVGEAPLPTEYGFSTSLTQFEGLGDRILPLMENGQRKLPLGVASEKLGRGNVGWVKRSDVTKSFVDRALEFIQQSKKSGKPFYVNVWPDDVHSPFDPPAELRGDGSKRALYNGVLTNMDAELAPLFDAVRQDPELRSNTLIIFASDNGPEPGAGSAGPFRSGKGSLYEGGIREPLIVWGPGFIGADKRGSVNKTAVISGVDFLPSLTALARAEAAPGDGSDLSATLTGKIATGRTRPLFWKRPPDRGGPKEAPLPDLAVRDGDWKLLIQEDGSHPQLYNVKEDEAETRNVASAQPEIVERLKRAILTWEATLPSNKSRSATNFDLKSGDHLNRDEAPDLEGTGITLTVKFRNATGDGQPAGGVIVAQGGVANGYSLHVDQSGALVFLIRLNKQTYSVKTTLSGTGSHTAVARIDADGSLSLSLDGQTPSQDKAPRGFVQQPLDGLDVGSDEGGLVGPYGRSNTFTGRIDSVTAVLEFRKDQD